MEEVRAEDYQKRDRAYDRFLSSEQDRQEMPMYQKLGLGVAATAGALAIGYRTGGMRRLASFIDDTVSPTRQALRETLEQERSIIKNFSLERLKQTNQRFQSTRRELMDARGSQDTLASRDFDMLRYMRQRSDLIEKEVPLHIREGLRFRSVMDELRQSSKITSDVANKIETGLSKGYNGILHSGNNADIRGLLNQEGVNDKEIIDLVNEVRRNNKGSNFNNKDVDAWTRGIQQKLRESTAQDLQHIVQPDRIIKRGLVGSNQRQATVQDILDLHREKRVSLDDDTANQMQTILDRYNKSFGEAVFDSNLYVNLKDGKAVGLSDYKAFDNIKRQQMEWWSHTLPGGLMHLRDMINIRNAREAAGFRIFERGTTQPMLSGHLGLKPDQVLPEEFVYSGGKFMRLFDNEAMLHNKPMQVLNEREMYLTSARFGALSKMSRQMSSTMTDGTKRFIGMDVTENRFFKTLDLGGQERDPIGAEGFTMLTKFFDKDWDRRRINRALKSGIDEPGEYHAIGRFLDQNINGLSPRALNQLKNNLPEYLVKEIDDMNINFSRNEDMLKLFRKLGSDAEFNTSYSFNQLYRRYERNPEDVLGQRTPKGQTNLIMGGQVEIQTGMDQINQEISKELIRQRINVAPPEMRSDELLNLRNIFRESQKTGDILKKDLEQAEWLINQQMFEQAGNNLGRSYENILDSTNNLFTGTNPSALAFQESMRDINKKINPIHHMNTNAGHMNQINDEFIAVNKANIWDNLQSFSGISDLLKQTSLRTGSRNMEDVTTLSLYGSYYPVYRLQDALSSLNLGLSQSSMGSPLQLWSSLFLKRGLPVVGAVEGYQYADYLMDEHTGAGFSERWENYKAHQRVSDAEKRERHGTIDDLRKERMLKPGIEHFAAMPSVHIPMLGEVGPGHVLNALTGGGPVNEYDTYGVEETYDDLMYGTEEIRKGRWWAFGSRTAYRGDRIIENRPNSYRLAHSDWEYSDVTASAEEQYAHSLFPTFENPLGILSFALGTRDPYWYEYKHFYDRPYMLTGDLFNPNTMLLGDIGNMTLGQILKPTREMHTEYWGDPVLMQEEVDQETERPIGEVKTRISPSGRVEFVTDATAREYGAVPYIVRDRYDSQTGEATGDQIIANPETGQTIFMPRRVNEQYQNIESAFYAASLNEERTVETTPRGVYAPAYEYQKEIDRQKLSEVIDPRSAEWRAQEFARNWLEPHGVYNWIFVDEVAGWDPYVGQTVIEKADAAYNASNSFWDQELGSLGGSLSEIGRRFIRRDSGQLDFYNPIRNTMPDWVPGSNYFINFQTGDAHSKIPFGERRLPGDAYERLNELHPDETGRYGAFDKMKILADIAPWSDEYRYWRDYVTEYEEDPVLRKRAAEIKRQVSRRSAKYEFQEYLYKDAELEKETVTVRRFLDDYTFLTEEYGDQPIRMAGVDARANAEGVLEQYFDVGDKITIGVDADPVHRVSNDTYGTMRAVVFRGINSLNREIIERGEMRALESDYSAPGVWARFTPEEIAKGARWESFAHMESAFNTKFLQVRTAVEEYEIDQIYLSDWATWENFGVSDYLIPAIDRMTGRDSMLAAGLSGGILGGVLGRFMFGGGRRTIGGLVIGTLTGLGANTFGNIYENINDERWIPERRRIEHDINEYFDILEYMKYTGLYEKAREELAHMGYDADTFLNYVEEKEENTKQRRRELEDRKQYLYINQPNNWEDERKQINKELQQITEEWDEVILPEPVAQALYYKEQAETTLYAIDPHDDRMKVMQALPYKDKWFFNEFAEAGTEDRETILSLIPENQRRLYQTIWGMEADERKPLEYYAEKYNIPDTDWEGWSPEYDLEDIKVRTVMRENVDLTDFNYWEDDIQRAMAVPDLPMEFNESSFEGFKSVERNIRDVLQGQGLRDVSVIVRPNNGGETHTRINFREDRSSEIEDEFRYNMEAYV